MVAGKATGVFLSSGVNVKSRLDARWQRTAVAEAELAEPAAARAACACACTCAFGRGAPCGAGPPRPAPVRVREDAAPEEDLSDGAAIIKVVPPVDAPLTDFGILMVVEETKTTQGQPGWQAWAHRPRARNTWLPGADGDDDGDHEC